MQLIRTRTLRRKSHFSTHNRYVLYCHEEFLIVLIPTLKEIE